MKFMIEIRDYEPGRTDRDIDVARLERSIERLLNNDGSDGVVIVKKVEDED